MAICVKCKFVRIKGYCDTEVNLTGRDSHTIWTEYECGCRWHTNPVTGEKTYPRCMYQNGNGTCPDFKPKEPNEKEDE